MADPLSPAELIRRAERLKADRGTFESHWQQVADYIMPSREFTKSRAPGSKRTELIFHTGPVMRCEQLSGANHGMLVSPALRWFALKPNNATALQDQSVRSWFDAATTRMNDLFSSPRGQFSLAVHEGFLDDSAFGTSVMWIHDKGYQGPQFQALPLAECMLAEDGSGVIDTLFRMYKMAARNVVSNPTWEKDIPDNRRREAENKPDEMWDLVHACVPDPKQRDRWVGIYILVQDKKQLGKTDTYYSKPFIASRWSKRSGEIYGNGPGMNALPDIRGLNKLEEEHLRGVILANSPPLLLPEDGFIGAVSQAPRAFNYMRADAGPGAFDKVGPLISGERPEVAAEKIQNYEQRIAECFYVSWMQLPYKPGMTATEFSQRRDEMLRLMSPVVARQQTEKLGPLIERTFDIMWRNGAFPEPPAVLSDMQWKVEYISPLALAQKGQDAQMALQWMAALAQMAAADPQVMDVMDADAMARFLAERYGAPTTVMRTDEVVVQLRDARAKRDQAVQQAQALQVAGQALQQGGAGAASLAQAAETTQGLGQAA